ncbi:TPA: hypothetical protein QCZ04_005004 [Bacillus cereus]|nr:hypothetical protein [Bacillus cereus]
MKRQRHSTSGNEDCLFSFVKSPVAYRQLLFIILLVVPYILSLGTLISFAPTAYNVSIMYIFVGFNNGFTIYSGSLPDISNNCLHAEKFLGKP